MADTTRKPDFLLLASVAGAIFLVFLLGVGFGVFKIFPYSVIDNAHKALVALQDESRHVASRYDMNVWAELRPESGGKAGVTTTDTDGTYDGVTLYLSGDTQAAYLIDMAGHVVHQWARPLSSIWNPAIATNELVADDKVYWRAAHVYPNGDLLVVCVGYGITPWGLALVRLDKDSNLVWCYQKNVHHDLDVGSDGRIYALTHEIRKAPPQGLEALSSPLIDDRIVILDDGGHELQTISLLEAIRDSPFVDVILDELRYRKNGDMLHANSIAVIAPDRAERLPFAEAGQILVCLREVNLIAVVDPPSARVAWMMRGPWHRPHDAEFLPDGNLMIFDNRGNLGAHGLSRVIEVDPATSQILWSYSGRVDAPFFSKIRARQQRLPNGNTLITESDGGRLLEVTRGGAVVWEFVNPVRGDKDGTPYLPIVMGGERYRRDELSFLPTPP
jgi:hypothetical protein